MYEEITYQEFINGGYIPHDVLVEWVDYLNYIPEECGGGTITHTPRGWYIGSFWWTARQLEQWYPSPLEALKKNEYLVVGDN